MIQLQKLLLVSSHGIIMERLGAGAHVCYWSPTQVFFCKAKHEDDWTEQSLHTTCQIVRL